MPVTETLYLNYFYAIWPYLKAALDCGFRFDRDCLSMSQL